MMRQYQEVKRAHPNALLMFRLGDFYELFGEDAEVASRMLDLVLTSRPVAKSRRIPMCGVPHHAAETYIARLVERGFRVAICDQVEDPKKTKGLVRRAVVRVVTPGTVTSDAMVPPRENVFIAATLQRNTRWGLAVADLGTGEFRITEPPSTAALADEIARLGIREVVHPADQPPPAGADAAAFTPYDAWRFDADTAERALRDQFGVTSLEGFGCAAVPVATAAAGALIGYLRDTQRSELRHFRALQVYAGGETMLLDTGAIRSLELFQPLIGDSRDATLLGVLDRTRTAMGGRRLRRWLSAPLLNADRIIERLDAVDELLASPERTALCEALSGVSDMERLVGRAGHGSANARDLLSLATSLAAVREVRKVAQSLGSRLLRDLASRADPHEGLRDRLERAIAPDAPASVREGGLIREGYDPDLDSLRRSASQARRWIADLEAQERERTGIRSLRVGYNKIFGYYIEITKAHHDRVPPHYERRQTLVGAERYVTPEMKEHEALISQATERMHEREYELFCALRDEVAEHSPSLLATADAVATLDALAALADCAQAYGYTRPEIAGEPVLDVTDGRHPVVERVLRAERFVPNDAKLGGDRRIAIVTGPNFGGKSTYLRQNALIVLMAQIGSFVPASRARLGPADRVFTRVGAADDIAGGRSTFLVEMQETANVLHNATPHSLVILDEVGRGTATYDGLSLAWAVVEYIWERIGCRTLFATHYHELTELADTLPGVFNLNAAVREEGDRVVFLRRVSEGASDRSYGIHVAQLAGIPREVTDRASALLDRLQSQAASPTADPAVPPSLARRARAVQTALPLVVESDVENELKSIDLAAMTPIEALNLLHEIQRRLRAPAHDDSSKVVRMRKRTGRDG